MTSIDVADATTTRLAAAAGSCIYCVQGPRPPHGRAAERAGATALCWGGWVQVVATGVVFRPTAPPERLRDVVQAAEAAGVAELWLWEDCFAAGGLTAAAAALAWSTRLRVGIGLLPVALRNPALVAMEVATVARLFPGRFVPGVGHGELGALGRAGVAPASPMALLREHTAAVRDLLHGRRLDADGRYVTLDGVALDRPPAPPPLLVGARGPRTLRLAGELADGVILDAIAAPDELRAACAEVDAGRAAAGRTDPYEVVVYVEPRPGLPHDELTDIVGRWRRELGGAGATSVVFVGSPDAPDPAPLLRALAASAGRRRPEPTRRGVVASPDVDLDD